MAVLSPARRTAVGVLIAVVVVGLSSIVTRRADAAAWSTVQPGAFTGYAFDACTAPPDASMRAWRARSPYRAIGIYLGGVNRGCAQPELTADWVRQQVGAGWKLLPLYVGPQATCTTIGGGRELIDNARAGTQGRIAASDAVARAVALGLARESVIIYDMEAYRTDDPTCRRGVLDFLNGWTARLHDNGYLSGFYSSVSSGVADQVANYATPGYTRPDYVDFARWDLQVTTADPLIPATAWPGKRRMKQYRGGHRETYGGVTINIDNDYVDFAPLPRAGAADLSGNGWSDVLGRSPTGVLSAFLGNGSLVDNNQRRTLGAGFRTMNAIVRAGDLDRDGRADVIARQTNGDLWFHPGTSTGLGPRKRLTRGWRALREITPMGDLTGDGRPDLLAVSPAGNLYLYAGQAGAKLAGARLVGRGWSGRTELAGAGDFDRDGFPDLIARLATDGRLYLWPGRRGGFTGRRVALNVSAADLRDLVGVGDFDRDGYPDLAAVRKTTGHLVLLAGAGSRLRAPFQLAAGYGGISPLA
ncbi:glycoside hydrolase domain-containing protein [Actinoplanes sp. M2I2]|uniref:glycoside hydrolase domain-containing protein n=1 Tax=Actinoplanes sp. M2I2 TaxID=1734444 RepID=UPI00202294E1|nr:glycoside hydrolase domain-containing protein [Actinoplanes sp. M2I2]